MIVSTLLAITAWQYMGVPYKWGGQDYRGMDCSGLVVRTLTDIGVLKEGQDYTAQGLYNYCKTLPGSSSSIFCDSLLFFGRNRDEITHVAISLGRIQGVQLMLEAGGAGRDSLGMDRETLLRRNARVRISAVNKRNDFVEGVLVPWDRFAEKGNI